MQINFLVLTVAILCLLSVILIRATLVLQRQLDEERDRSLRNLRLTRMDLESVMRRLAVLERELRAPEETKRARRLLYPTGAWQKPSIEPRGTE